jgi:predicted DNA binding protein
VIEALLSVRIPELWVTEVTEKHNIAVSCQIGGPARKGGWGHATITGEEGILDAVVDEIRLHPSVGEVRVDARQPGSVSLTVNVVRCKACEVLLRSKTFMVFPVEIRKGRMKWLLITDNNGSLGGISDKLRELRCEVKVERVTPLRGKEIVTSRQEEVLRKAFVAGYFDYPRKTDSTRLARELGISVSTFSEIMRAAQRRILAERLRA